jgi:hypothetical protein
MIPSSHWKSNKHLVWGQPDRSKSVLLRIGIEYVNLCVMNLLNRIPGTANSGDSLPISRVDK